MKDYFRLMRIHHYIKNFLVFLPLIFSKRMFESDLILKTVFAFISFSFISSFVYIINDIKDLEKDKLHSTKCNRPIASGKVKVSSALVLALFLLIASLVINTVVLKASLLATMCIAIYIVANFFYSVGLKQVPILDVAILAVGFFLRLLYGALITGIEISTWFYLTTILGSFYLGLGKRRNELKMEGDSKRDVLKLYSYDFLDKNMYMCLSLAIVFYSLWTIDALNKGNGVLIWTIPLLVLICMKYNFNIERDGDGDPTEIILKDKILLIMILLYGILMFLILYTLCDEGTTLWNMLKQVQLKDFF